MNTVTEAKEIFNATTLTVQFSNHQRPEDRKKISNSGDAYHYIKSFFGMDIELREKFFVILMNRARHVIGVYKLSEGGMTETTADIRILLAVALQTLATDIILCHNHPSCNLRPSRADKSLTDKIKTAALYHDLTVVDHIIATEYEYYSFADEGII